VRPGFSLKRRQLQRRENNGHPVLGSSGAAPAAASGAPKVEDARMAPADGSILYI
jgi:hypothetical protein